jgi:hypothetical protein
MVHSRHTAFGRVKRFLKNGRFFVVRQDYSLGRVRFLKRAACTRNEFLFAFSKQGFPDRLRGNRRGSTADEPDSRAQYKGRDGVGHVGLDYLLKSTVAQTGIISQTGNGAPRKGLYH